MLVLVKMYEHENESTNLLNLLVLASRFLACFFFMFFFSTMDSKLNSCLMLHFMAIVMHMYSSFFVRKPPLSSIATKYSK